MSDGLLVGCDGVDGVLCVRQAEFARGHQKDPRMKEHYCRYCWDIIKEREASR